jgi:arginase
VTCVPAEKIKDLAALLDNIDAREIYLHIDLDVLDESEGRANTFAVGRGLSAADLHHSIEVLAGRFLIRGAALTAYDPKADSDGRIAKIAIATAIRVLAAVANTP